MIARPGKIPENLRKEANRMATPPHLPPPDERDILESELATLARLQLEAVECAQLVPMTDEELLQFERRGHRITKFAFFEPCFADHVFPIFSLASAVPYCGMPPRPFKGVPL